MISTLLLAQTALLKVLPFYLFTVKDQHETGFLKAFLVVSGNDEQQLYMNVRLVIFNYQ